MKGYYRKIYLYLLGSLLVAAALWMMNSGILVEGGGQAVQLTLPEAVDALPEAEMAALRRTALVLYDPDSEASVKYKGNLERVCRWLRLDADFLPAGRKDTVSYTSYDLVAVAFSDWEGLIGPDCARLLRYVEQGGRLFLGLLPDAPGSVYQTLHRSMGIIEYGDYYETEGFDFVQELLPGSRSQSFRGADSFGDACLGVQIEPDCTLFMTASAGGRDIPMVWRHDVGGGRILTFNATAIVGDMWTGVAAGCLCSLFDSWIYPVINTKTVFIDDFPSPQYNADNETIHRDYNRTVREFFRDIWWPDMQSAAKRYNIQYVGLFMATYDDIVDPARFAYQRDATEQYFGNSLLENGYEMGAHGYNHQSLVLEGQAPDDLGYNPWGGVDAMAASLTKLVEITADLFPGVRLYTYVPPSNYLSEEGRQAVAAALPDLQVISGVYTMEGETGSVYVQDFGVAADGVVEFPRATSGMLEDEYDRFASMSVAGLYGVYSHFIHPDDILDEERGGGLGWQALYEQFCDKLNFINECFEGLRPMTAVEAAGALRAACQADVAVTVAGDQVQGYCNGFTGQAYCYLRSERRPVTDNDSCQITRVCSDYDGYYYLVRIDAPAFSFKLEG